MEWITVRIICGAIGEPLSSFEAISTVLFAAKSFEISWAVVAIGFVLELIGFTTMLLSPRGQEGRYASVLTEEQDEQLSPSPPSVPWKSEKNDE